MDGAEATEWYDDEAAGRALSQISEIGREQIFIGTKIHPVNLSFNETSRSFERLLRIWNDTEYLDLVLLHFPACGSWIPNCRAKKGGDWKSAYRALESHYEAGRLRSIGVSNFDVVQLEELVQMAKHGPHVIQNWLDPFHQSRELVNFARRHHIVFTAYSSFGTQWQNGAQQRNHVLQSHTLAKIANHVNKPITTVVLSWLMSMPNMTVIPRSTKPVHIFQNSELLTPGVAESLLSVEQRKWIDDLDGLPGK